jgi:hypothetical protein
METYKVLSYDVLQNVHRVQDEQGATKFVDLMVHGDFPEGTTHESLVGQTFVCDYTYPYISIAMNVRPQPEPKNHVPYNQNYPTVP